MTLSVLSWNHSKRVQKSTWGMICAPEYWWTEQVLASRAPSSLMRVEQISQFLKARPPVVEVIIVLILIRAARSDGAEAACHRPVSLVVVDQGRVIRGHVRVGVCNHQALRGEKNTEHMSTHWKNNTRIHEHTLHWRFCLISKRIVSLSGQSKPLKTGKHLEWDYSLESWQPETQKSNWIHLNTKNMQ